MTIPNGNIGILQDIMNDQGKLDRTILKERDLFSQENEPDLMVNFDENRKRALFISYAHLRTAVRMIRKVGAKWWKNQRPMGDDDFNQFLDDMRMGMFLDSDTSTSNTSMKIMAIVQELVELEDAINEGKGIDDIHEEFIDVIHFIVSLGLDLGINKEQKVKQLYSAKNAINHTRQQSNY